MRKNLEHSVEIFGQQATLYVAGQLDEAHVFQLNRICGELPNNIVTLRLDLHSAEHLSASTIAATRSLLRNWRETRGGSFRLVISGAHMVATYAETSAAERKESLRNAMPHIVEVVNPAQSAIFL